MFQRVHFVWRARVGCLAGLLTLVVAAAAPAQSLNDGMEGLEKMRRQTRDLSGKIFTGEQAFDPKSKPDLEAVDVAAMYSTYPYVLEVGAERVSGKLDKIFENFLSDLSKIEKYKDKSPELGKFYSHNVMVHALEVINLAGPTAKPVARLNAARTLARLAVLGQGELADALVETLRAPRKQEDGRDGIRYWVLRGLHDLLSQPPQTPPLFDESKVTLALLEFLNEKPFVSQVAPQEEIEGYRMLRREAVRALAQTHKARLKDKALPALVLARFAGNDQGIQPPPRLDERLEAALGLARLRPSKEWPTYQPDYAAQQIVQFLSTLGNLSNDTQAERIGFKKPRPWKIDGTRLVEALTAMREQVKDPYVAKALAVGLRIAQTVRDRGQCRPEDLAWLANPANAAPNQELFKGIPDTTVKSALVELSTEK